MKTIKFTWFLASLLLVSCDFKSGSKDEKLNCDINFTSYQIIELHELSPPVYLINQIINSSDGEFFFSQYRDPVVGRIGADGTFLNWIGRYGQGPGEFLSSYISLDGSDSLFIQDHLSGNITVFAHDEYSQPARIFSYQRLEGDLILSKPGEYLTFQSFPLVNLSNLIDSVFIINFDKGGLVIDTILSIKGPEFIIDQTDRTLNIIHVVDRRNVSFQFNETNFIIFENDTNVVPKFDYTGTKLNESYFPIPKVVDYSSLIERQFSQMSGISSEKITLELERLTKNNPPIKLALYQEAINIEDNYFFKLISNQLNSMWLSYNNIREHDISAIYCHENPTMTLKGHNGKYYYGLALSTDFEQQLHLMLPSYQLKKTYNN
jgi:hypothetical protein